MSYVVEGSINMVEIPKDEYEDLKKDSKDLIKAEQQLIKMKEEYIELSKRDQWLTALEAAGVDNWDGIDYAVEILEEWEAE